MNKKPDNNSIILQIVFIVSSMLLYKKARPIVGPISVKIFCGISRLLGFRKFADLLYGSIEYELGDEGDDDEIHEIDESDDDEIHEIDESDDDEIPEIDEF